MAEETKQTPKLELIRASEIDPKSVEWLWYPFIPYGKVTLVQGDPGDGKSTFLLTIAAMLTKGAPLPFTEPETPPEPMCVIYQTTDEEWDDRFVEACHRIDQVEYYLDELWYADWPEREIIMNDLQSDMERIAKKPEISRLFSPEGPSL